MNRIVKELTEEVLAGGGEMGGRMRAINWAQNPLGPVSEWPSSLRTAIRIVLTSSQPMFVWWGPQLINLYNDAYIPYAGDKHPSCLGRSAAFIWQEIWDKVAPRLEYAMHQNEGTFDEALQFILERYGYKEETYFTFSYSPIPIDGGQPGGIFCACIDETRRIVDERQLALLKELATAAVDARTVADACTLSAAALNTNSQDMPFALIYLADPDRHAFTLCGTAGFGSAHPAAPASIAEDDETEWPLGSAVRKRNMLQLNGFAERHPDLPHGAWESSPTESVIVPITAAGETAAMIIGLNPYRLFDAPYRRLIELVAAQVAANIGRAHAYQEERKRAEALADIDRAKTAFFSNVSHEFRTPLTLMLGPLEDILAQSESQGTRDNRKSLAIVHRNALRLLKLVNTLLEFSRIEAGRSKAVFESTDLAAYTMELASAFRSATQRAGLALKLDCPPLSEPVCIDRDMWEKIVLNLLSNAFKFTFEGEIEVSLREEGDSVVLCVRDTGIGIPEASLPEVFERFHRVEGSRGRTHEGTGIGLALVRELARMHHGTASAESEPGKGSRFCITIPRGLSELCPDQIVNTGTAAAPTGAVHYAAEALSWLAAGGRDAETSPHPFAVLRAGAMEERRARIIVADDNRDMRDYLRRLLADKYDVETVADGQEALEAASRERPDLVLSDIMMPRVDGFELLRQLRSNNDTGALPVILVSARAGEEAKVQGLEHGADDYLIKPFSARELLARVSAHLELARVRRESTQREIELRQQAEQARDEQREIATRYHLAGRATGDTIWDWDLVSNEISWNESLAKSFGFPLQPNAHDISWWRSKLHPDDAVTISQGLQDIIKGTDHYWSAEYRFQRADGSYATVFDRGYVLRDDDNRPQRMIGAMSDITERKRNEEEMRLLNAELEKARDQAVEASCAKSVFLANMSHELRTPLNAIIGYAELLEDDAGKLAGADIARDLTRIQNAGRHLLSLINDILDLSKIEAGRMEIATDVFRVSDLVDSVCDTVRPLIIKNGNVFDVSCSPALDVIVADEMKIRQVLLNLLGNAGKFTEQGKVTLEVFREPGIGRDLMVFRVTDSGLGMSAEELTELFEAFAQIDSCSTKRHGGTGLGLAISRRLCRLMGGDIGVRSIKGEGSTFTATCAFMDPGMQL